VGLPSKFGARLHGSGAFFEETIAAAALLDYEALTRKAAELRFLDATTPRRILLQIRRRCGNT